MTGPRLADILRNPTTVRVIKLLLSGLVLAGLVRHVLRTLGDLDARNLTLAFSPTWLVGAAVLYLAGLLAQGVYFGRVLARGPTPIGGFAAVRAYLISHLAKYVPGKAMVVVVRSALASRSGARPATAAFATLYETLVMMATGGLVAALGFTLALDPGGGSVAGESDFGRPGIAGLPSNQLALALGSLGLAAGLGLLVLVWPSVFPRLAGFIRRPLRGVGADALPRLSGRGLLAGLGWSALGWTLLGLSQVAVILGIEIRLGSTWPLGPAEWPVVVGSVALATVAGFVVPIAPGGLGVREWVLWTSLGLIIDRDRAVIATLVLRLVWVAAEVVAAAVLLPIRPRARPTDG